MNVIDTRVLGKPSKYGGDREQWVSWKFVFKSYIGALDGEMLNEVEACEKLTRPIALGILPEDTQRRSRTMSYILAQTLTAAPLLTLMNAESHNGYEAWRRLVVKEEPTHGERAGEPVR